MILDYILGGLVGVGLGILLIYITAKRRFARQEEVLRTQLDVEIREARLAHKEARVELEIGFKNRELELTHSLAAREDELKVRARELEREHERQVKLQAQLNTKLKELTRDQRLLNDAERKVEKMRRLYQLKLYQLTQMKREDAQQLLIKATEQECEQELRDLRRKKLKRAEAEVAAEAKRILLAAMQRITAQPMNDATATVVALPSEELKGRIIGREGRNIRSFEHATGTTLMIDETPDSVMISCFDPVRREIGRIALEALLRDGRIHPFSIEEEVAKAEDAMKANVIDLGESALRQLRLYDVHPEVVALLGKLHYRLSNNQNTLTHSVEVANLCALIAAEIGLDPVIAKRAGLFHDIGKAASEEYEGSHATVGSEIIKQHGEDARVVNAAAAHHQEVPAESVYAGLVMVADSLSAVRPGARASSIEGFIQRVQTIETIAAAQPGVSEAYAMQAGRAVRVIVEPALVNDEEAQQLARTLRQKIEAQLNYPGTIEITVIREQRYTETAV